MQYMTEYYAREREREVIRENVTIVRWDNY